MAAIARHQAPVHPPLALPLTRRFFAEEVPNLVKRNLEKYLPSSVQQRSFLNKLANQYSNLRTRMGQIVTEQDRYHEVHQTEPNYNPWPSVTTVLYTTDEMIREKMLEIHNLITLIVSPEEALFLSVQVESIRREVNFIINTLKNLSNNYQPEEHNQIIQTYDQAHSRINVMLDEGSKSIASVASKLIKSSP